jgi:hypothetical protein
MAFLKDLGIKDMHCIHPAQDAGSHECRSEFSEVLAKLYDYQLFKEGCSMVSITRLSKKSSTDGS